MLHMTMQPLVEQVRQQLEQAQAELQERHPQVKLRTYYGPARASPHIAYQVVLSACFPPRSASEAESFSLNVSIERLETAPALIAEVVWDDPSGYLEGEWQDDLVPWSLAAGSQLLADLPQLLQVFAAAVERGKPSNQTRP
jgi:hypothetical protein